MMRRVAEAEEGVKESTDVHQTIDLNEKYSQFR